MAGINLNNARNRTVVEAVTGLSTAPEGFTMEPLAEGVRARAHWSAEQYSVRRAAYDLALQVRMKRLFQTLGLNTNPPTN